MPLSGTSEEAESKSLLCRSPLGMASIPWFEVRMATT